MTAVGWLPADAEELFGTDATAEESYDVLTVDVPPAGWITALETARDRLGCTYFDWLSAVDEPGSGFRVTAHVAALSPLRRLLLRTTVPHEAPALPSAVGVFAGAAWHERETYEMFGITFEGHPALDHLLLPENFEGHPLRKDFVLAARVAKAWPGAKEPGESEHGGPKRRQMLPPGVPDPNEWGPLKGQLPPAPARGAGRAAGDRPTRGAARPAGERPVRRARSVSEGSASQSAAGERTPAGGAETPTGGAGASGGGAGVPTGSAGASGGGTSASGAGASGSPRRARSAAEGSVSQSAAEGTPASGAEASAGGAGASAGPRRARSAVEGSVSQSMPGEPTAPASAGPRRNRSASQGSASQQPGSPAAPEPGSASPATGPESATPGSASPTSDAPWHHARPAFDEPAPETAPKAAKSPAPEPSDGSQTSPTSEPADASQPSSRPESRETPGSSEAPESPDASQPSSRPESPDATEPPTRSESLDATDATDAADAQAPATEPQPTDTNVKPAASPGKPDHPEDPAGGPQ
ncbi:NADH-quinone oxidoreductase subunit C [Streptomyces luteogriseus]|uniref:NADH-quinone oxidoreductase subunit C n=1 Tax=Streptomyces luteogriseus TaxID=68233 RepID=UPI0037AA87EE